LTENTQHIILVTRPLSSEQIEYAGSLGLVPVIAPALRVEFPADPDRLLKKLDKTPDVPWVFTSKNGVEGFRRIQQSKFRIRNIPKTYAVGDKTAGALKELGISAHVPDEQHASGLAKVIIKKEEIIPAGNDKPKIIHWCGNRSRPELKEELAAAGIDLIPLEVYATYLNELKLPEKPIDAILFYSPSAVEAFRHSGGFKTVLPELFAIGKTTAEALSMEADRHVHIPSVPSTERMLELVAGVLKPAYIDLNKRKRV